MTSKAFSLSRGAQYIFVGLAAVLLSLPVIGQTTLSANSGINAADTYAIFDITLQSQATINLTQAVHDNSTNTNTTALQSNPAPKHFHVEVGFDANDQIVLNMFSQDAVTDPTATITDSISKVQLANGKMVLYDQTGAALPIELPENAPVPNPLTWLGLAPGPSVLGGIIVPDVPRFAAAIGANVVSTTNASTVSGPQANALTTLPATQTIAAAVHASSGGTANITYQAAGSVWVVSQLVMTPVLPNMTASRTLQFSNVVWNDNATGDTRRAARATTIQAPPASATMTTVAPAPSTASTNCTALTEVQNATGQNLVLQHGIFSSGSTWSTMDTWLSAKYQFGTKIIPSIDSPTASAALSSQATCLLNTLLIPSGKSGFLSIGHSQGGLILRDAAQREQALNPAFFRGVVTVDTPHLGALIDENGRQEVADLLVKAINDLLDAAGCSSLFDNIGCLVGGLLAEFSLPITDFALDTAFPATGDLLPGSPYLNTLNSKAETFTRVGVEGHSNKRFILARLGGDAFCGPLDGFCGGRTLAAFTEDVYIAFRVCEVIAILYYDFDVAAFCGHVADVMDHVDQFWDKLTAPGDFSDGIVQGASQHYAGATASYVIGNADSHVGATRSDKVEAVLEQTLDKQFFVPRAGCTFSLSGASASFTDLGGSASVTLTAGSTCSWATISNVPWATVSLASGKGATALSIAVQPNVSPVSRTGTLTIAGLTYTLTEAGASGATGIVNISGFDQIQVINTCNNLANVAPSSLAAASQSQGPQGSAQPLPPPCQNIIEHDFGTVFITVNGHTNTVSYGSGDSFITIATKLANAINADTTAPVSAAASSGNVFLFARASGVATNYPYSAGSTHESGLFIRPSFTTRDSGLTLTGGH